MANRIRLINPPALETPPGYSHVVEVQSGPLVFIAGQAATDRDGNIVGAGDPAAQAEQAFRNLGTALASVGCTARHLIKLTVFLRDMDRLADYRTARNRFFATVTPPAAPAITLIEVSKLVAAELLIEIEAFAAPDAQ